MMNINNLRVFNITESLLILAITLVVLSVVLVKVFKQANKKFIPLLLSIYGCAFCGAIVFVFGEGFTGIPFVLMSWLFLFFIVVSAIVLVVQHFSKKLLS